MSALFQRLCHQETGLRSVLEELPVESKGCREMGEQKESDLQYQAMSQQNCSPAAQSLSCTPEEFKVGFEGGK